MMYWIRATGVPQQPITEDDLFSKYGDHLVANTPCAKVGENKWGGLSDYFPNRPLPKPQEPPNVLPAQTSTKGELILIGLLIMLMPVIGVITGIIVGIRWVSKPNRRSDGAIILALCFSLIAFVAYAIMKGVGS